MKSKALITMAVASTFGWSAGAFAGSSHEVQTPFSVTESGPNVIAQHSTFESSSMSSAMSESISHDTGHNLQLSDSSDWSASFDQMAEADLGDGYLVSWTDYYLFDVSSSDELATLGDTYFLVPVDYVAFVPSDDYAASQEERVDMILSESPVFDTAEVG